MRFCLWCFLTVHVKLFNLFLFPPPAPPPQQSTIFISPSFLPLILPFVISAFYPPVNGFLSSQISFSHSFLHFLLIGFTFTLSSSRSPPLMYLSLSFHRPYFSNLYLWVTGKAVAAMLLGWGNGFLSICPFSCLSSCLCVCITYPSSIFCSYPWQKQLSINQHFIWAHTHLWTRTLTLNSWTLTPLCFAFRFTCTALVWFDWQLDGWLLKWWNHKWIDWQADGLPNQWKRG